MNKPLLLRIAPAVLLGLAAYTAAFLAVVLGTVSGVAVAQAGPRDAAELGIGAMSFLLVLQTSIYAALAWGVWRERSWTRPMLVWQGPVVLLILLVLARGPARLGLIPYLPSTAVIALLFYWYLYRKQNVREYWARHTTP